MKAINLYQIKFTRLMLGLSFLSCIIFISGLMLGTIAIPVNELLHYFTSQDPILHFTIQARFYREITAFCCGGLLAVGSAIIQGLTRNSMAAPDLTGMTSIGCLLIVAIEMHGIKSSFINEILGIVGAMLGLMGCILLTKNYQGNNRLMIILTGISISFTANAIMQLLVLHAPENMDHYLHFITGSLYGVSSESVSIVLWMTLLMAPVVLLLSFRFSIFALDNETCLSVGVPVKRYWMLAFLIAAILVGTSIIGVGHLGFLGIVAPNVARMFIGNRPQYIFPSSFLIGGCSYLIADTLGRCLISPAEIPAGIMTNMLSAPVFLLILFRYYRGQHEWH